MGITLIEFAQMEPPNHEMSPMRVLLKIQKSDPPKLEQPGKWTKEFNDFIAKALIKDPSTRPTADELLKHPFINCPLDSKPIRDLLLEYKADVVEEELVDEETEVESIFVTRILDFCSHSFSYPFPPMKMLLLPFCCITFYEAYVRPDEILTCN